MIDLGEDERRAKNVSPETWAQLKTVQALTAERDAALARIAELEAELEVAMRPHSECGRSGAEAGVRIVDLEGDLAGAEARIAELEKSYRIIERLYKIERQERIEADDAVVTVEQIADEIAGHPIGGGYYQTTVSIDEAREIAEDVLALLRGEEVGDE